MNIEASHSSQFATILMNFLCTTWGIFGFLAGVGRVTNLKGSQLNIGLWDCVG
jgi:hypothetical protein